MSKIDVCLCCDSCDHDSVGRVGASQFGVCNSCDEPVTSSNTEVSVDVITKHPTIEDRRKLRGVRN